MTDHTSAGLAAAVMAVFAERYRDGEPEDRSLVSELAKDVLRVIDKENCDFSSSYLCDSDEDSETFIEMGIARLDEEEGLDFLFFDYEE